MILGLAVIAEGLFIAKNQFMKTSAAPVIINNSQSAGGSQPARTPPTPLTKGTVFSDSPIFKYAHQIAPGMLSDDAKTALNGFTMTQTTDAGGSLVVTLTPKESDDQKQEYSLKSGEKLYFVEMTTGDDQIDSATDNNLRDDYGVIVDSNGSVQ